MKKKSPSIGGAILLPGLVFLLLSPVLLLLSKTGRQKLMNTRNSIGEDLFYILLGLGINITLCKYLVAQAAHETANFTSKIFKLNNNLFGMKLPKVRLTTAIGEKYGHAVFKSLEDSAEDMAFYLAANRMNFIKYKSLDEYIEDLKSRKYFEADLETYKNGCKHFYTLYYAGK